MEFKSSFVENLTCIEAVLYETLTRTSFVNGDMSCMLEDVVMNITSFGLPANDYPWAIVEDLESRTPFEAFVTLRATRH